MKQRSQHLNSDLCDTNPVLNHMSHTHTKPQKQGQPFVPLNNSDMWSLEGLIFHCNGCSFPMLLVWDALNTQIMKCEVSNTLAQRAVRRLQRGQGVSSLERKEAGGCQVGYGSAVTLLSESGRGEGTAWLSFPPGRKAWLPEAYVLWLQSLTQSPHVRSSGLGLSDITHL